METKKAKEEIIVEPISTLGMMAPLISEEVAAPLKVLEPEAVAGVFGAKAATTSEHFIGLSNEMSASYYCALSLLYKMFKYTFYYGTQVQTTLSVPGVWEVGETATYKVTVNNRNYFDLTSLRVFLSVTNDPGDTGQAEITGPSSQLIGDLAHNSSNTVSFTVKAKKTGIVRLAVTCEGFIGPCKQKFSFVASKLPFSIY